MMAREARIGALIAVLAGSVVPAIAADLPFGKNVTADDRARIVKLENLDVHEIDVTRELDIAKIDLNGDGALDYVVIVNSSLYCGTGGCQAAIYFAESGRHRQVANMLAHGVSLGEGSTKGVRDLVQHSRGGEVRWTWDGSKYQRQLPGKAK